MRKIGFIFPGQGSQYVGMGKDIYEEFHVGRKVFQEADGILGRKISDCCFKGPRKELDSTENSQVAIVTVSIAILKVLQSFKVEASVVAGLSLGEYSALICGGAMTFEDGLKIVEKRGKFMKKACENNKGSMAAVMGENLECIENICVSLKSQGIITIANYNCPSQRVISGESHIIDRAIEKLKEQGGFRVVKLPVSGGFHTELMSEASLKLKNELKNFQFNKLNTDFVPNVTGKVLIPSEDLKSLLEKQVKSSVLWEKSIESMINMGVDTFIEIGPSKALSGFVRKINSTVKVFNVSDKDSLFSVLDELKIGV